MTPIIDIHVHIQPQRMVRPEALAMLRHGRKDLAEIEKFAEDPSAFLKHLDSLGVERAGIINYVSPAVIGFPPEVNDWCAKYCAMNPERLIAFGGFDPATTPDAGAEVDRLVRLGIRGLKLHPAHQAISPNAYRDGCRSLAQMYERAQANHLPLMVHTGTSVFPGARNLHAQPLLVDDVSVDYPDLVVILAHGGRPLWMKEAFFLVRRHKNMHTDISGIPLLKLLKYFPRLEQIANKVLWGTDWPGPGMPEIRKNIQQFRSLPISEGAKSKILYGNAARLFPVAP